jgi:hypothetical protein
MTTNPSTRPDPTTISECLVRIHEAVDSHPIYCETAITELHSLLNKLTLPGESRRLYPLVRDGFVADDMLKKIRDTANLPLLKVPQIRYKADELAKAKNIPLPNSTRKHKEPLLQWFQTNWNELEADVRIWGGAAIPDAD